MTNKRILVFAVCVCLLLSACQSPEITEPQPDMVESQENLLTDFILSKADNPSLRENIVFHFDSTTQTFYYHTQEWIDSIHRLIPVFFADGNAFANNQEIITAITPIDFSRRQITCQIRKDNTYRNYTIELRCPQSTELPVLNIRTDNGKGITSKTEYSRASVDIYTPGDSLPYLQQRAYIRGRGNSTWWLNKKPYRLKLDKKAPLFGMQPAKVWVLLANALDPTLLCNTVALEAARRMEIPYTNHTQPVEVFINRRYYGSYVLTEAVQVKTNRIPADTLAGGFLAEFDSNYDEAYQKHSRIFALPVMLKNPETPTALNSVLHIVNSLEDILSSTPAYTDYAQLIDVESVIQYMLLNEVVKNGELCHPKSVFAYRINQTDVLHIGPPWDFDWGFGYQGSDFHYFIGSSKLMLNAYNTYEPGSKFFCSFLKDPVFCSMYAARWREIEPLLQDIDQYIYDQAYLLRYSQEENAIRWGQTHINYDTQVVLMADFLRKRIAAMSQAFLQYE